MKLLLSTLLFTLFSISLSAYDRQRDFSLIISGGISLGSYEAGYNWALLKYLNQIKDDENAPVRMHSIAGASAGAINAVMSAMAWCRDKEHRDEANLIDDNLFYHMWTNVDFEDLFIDKEFGSTDKKNTTSLFSRKKIERLSETMLLALNDPYYETTCKVPFGFAVTSVEPKISKIQDIEITNKLFHIPLYLSVDAQGKAKIIDNFDLFRDNILHLSDDGFPTQKRIQKALFASSAFPIAFEQVELEYFHHGVFEKALFLDGGVFDNVPLDFARRLSLDQASHYIFMDPKHMRRELPPLQTQRKKTTASPINSAVDLLGDIFSASESSILYNALAEEFDNEQKEVQISSRYFPITGMFLEHFGAFLDKGFRDYDYYVGVYDAIVDNAAYHCQDKKQNHYCEKESRKKIYELISKGSDRAKYMLNLLSSEEFGNPFERVDFPVQKDLHAIFKSINFLNYQDIEEFHAFIYLLNEHDYRAKNSYLKHTLQYPKKWYRRPLSSVMHRIVNLEKKNSDNLSKAFASVGAYGTGTFYRNKSGYNYNPVSAPLDYDKLWVKLFPYEMAFGKNSLSIGYENYYYFDHENILLPKAIEIKPSLSFELRDQADQTHFFRTDLNLNYELKRDMITVGFGPSVYKDLTRSIDSKVGYGTSIYVDVLNILRVTYAQRVDYAGKDSYIYVGINDIPSFIYWIFD
jgi:predicted acylesterase/phospholipase RssA